MAGSVTGSRARKDDAVAGDGITSDANADAILATMESVERALDKPKDEWTSSFREGVRFKLKGVAPYLLREAGKKFVAPKIPTFINPEKDREEENPNDPDYKAALSLYGQQLGELTQRMYLGWGCKPLDLPDTITPLEDDSWVDDIEEVAEIAVPRKGTPRYVAWLRYHVFPDIEELLELNQAIMRFNGVVFEADVQAAADTFKSDEARQPDSDDKVEAAPA